MREQGASVPWLCRFYSLARVGRFTKEIKLRWIAMELSRDDSDVALTNVARQWTCEMRDGLARGEMTSACDATLLLERVVSRHTR